MSDPASPDPTPALKRRKTSSALFKPFKSPFKTPLKPNAGPSSSKETPVKSSAPDNNLSSKPNDIPPQTTNPATTVSAAPKSTSTTPDTTTNSTTLRRRPTQSISPPTKPSSELTALQREHTSLLQTLRTVTSTLDTATQALKIESSTRDAELSRLIEVWKAASRQAAEEIYAGVRDRVNRMGGVKAWRERERESKMGWGRGWDNGPAGETGNGDGSGEYGEEEGLEDEGAQERREREGAELEREREVEAERDAKEEEGFTIDMMLRTLNIDLDVIGYDKELQRWID